MPEYVYQICFHVDPVEIGFTCHSPERTKEFKGLDAFNQYFGTLLPNEAAEALPDVWVGNYQITLVKFISSTSPLKLKQLMKSFHCSLEKSPVREALFRCNKLGSIQKDYYTNKRHPDDPIAVYVSSIHKLTLDFLEEIRSLVGPIRWHQVPEQELHMCLRRYFKETGNDGRPLWSWERVCQLGIPEQVITHPIKFYCSGLEVIAKRKELRFQCNRRKKERWWDGVTEINGKCSGCGAQVEASGWNGVCRSCGDYESLKPIWSLPYSFPVSQQLIFSSCNVDGFIATGHSDVQELVMKALLTNMAPDMVFIQGSSADEDRLMEKDQIPIAHVKYNYQNLLKKTGVYYNSRIIEFIQFLNVSDLGITIIKQINKEIVNVETTFYIRQYCVLAKRKCQTPRTHIKTNVSEPWDGVFIAMSCRTLACPDDLKPAVTELFWEDVLLMQDRVRSKTNKKYPMIIAIEGSFKIETQESKLPEGWQRHTVAPESQDKQSNMAFFCYPGDGTKLEVLINEFEYFDPSRKENYEKDQWEQLQAFLHQQQQEKEIIKSCQFTKVHVGFKS